MAIERDGDIIGLYGDGGKKTKCILIIVVFIISLRNWVECLGDLFIGGGPEVDVVGTKDNVVAEPRADNGRREEWERRL